MTALCITPGTRPSGHTSSKRYDLLHILCVNNGECLIKRGAENQIVSLFHIANRVAVEPCLLTNTRVQEGDLANAASFT